MTRNGISRSTGLTLFALLGTLVFASEALAATYSFGWQHWIGGDRDSHDWHASQTGTHQWVKETCGPDAVGAPSGNFTVEIRRNRSFEPDVSLGTQQFACNNSDASAEYYSDGGGDHHFRFPSVDIGTIGINGTGHVNYP
jgi:hypothetical protein